MIKLIWDFHGMESAEIAKHHAKHLSEFAVRESLLKTSSGTTTLDDYHNTAWIIILPEDMEKVRDALKPHRGEKVIG